MRLCLEVAKEAPQGCQKLGDGRVPQASAELAPAQEALVNGDGEMLLLDGDPPGSHGR